MRRLLAVLVLGAVGACGDGTPDLPPIDDAAFVRSASARCEKGLPPLRPDLSDDTKFTPQQVAAQVEEKEAELRAFIGTLRDLPVASAARDEADAWFADWDAYLDVGRRYADALRDDDPERYQAIAVEGDRIQERISGRARSSDMASCALDGVPLPERESPL